MIRRFGEPVETGRKYTHRPGAYALLPRGRELLVTFQRDPFPEFQLPGGGIDAGESPVSALYREVLEETGWTIARPRRLGAFRRFVFMPEYEIWAEKVCMIYVARPVRQIMEPLEPGHSAHWISDSLAQELLGNPGDQHFASHYLG